VLHNVQMDNSMILVI